MFCGSVKQEQHYKKNEEPSPITEKKQLLVHYDAEMKGFGISSWLKIPGRLAASNILVMHRGPELQKSAIGTGIILTLTSITTYQPHAMDIVRTPCIGNIQASTYPRVTYEKLHQHSIHYLFTLEHHKHGLFYFAI